MWPTSITPLLKSDNLEFIDKAFMNSATEPSTREDTRIMKEKFSKTAVATTAETIWFPYSDEPNMPIARAAAP